MDLTQGTPKEKLARSKKTMMWFAMISMAMVFAGLTSAFIVSQSRKDWLLNLELPIAFTYSLCVMLCSSVTLILSKRLLKNNKLKASRLCLLVTLILGTVFIFLQFQGFQGIIDQGYRFTGKYSNVTWSFIYLIVFTHILHVLPGIIVLITLIYNHFKNRYSPTQFLGLELGTMYWHFVDAMWLYLFVFFYVTRL